jgi:hypothetical protein
MRCKLDCTPLVFVVSMTTTSTISREWVLNVGQQWGKHLFQWWDHPDCCVTLPSGGWWWRFEALGVLRDWVRVLKTAVRVMNVSSVVMYRRQFQISRYRAPQSNVVRFPRNVSHLSDRRSGTVGAGRVWTNWRLICFALSLLLLLLGFLFSASSRSDHIFRYDPRAFCGVSQPVGRELRRVSRRLDTPCIDGNEKLITRLRNCSAFFVHVPTCNSPENW